MILLANGEGLWWETPRDAADVGGSPFARLILEELVLGSVNQ